MKILILSLCCLCLNLATAQASSGLKTVDYDSQTTATTEGATMPSAPSMTPEQMKSIMETVQKAGERQKEQAKALEELDQDE